MRGDDVDLLANDLFVREYGFDFGEVRIDMGLEGAVEAGLVDLYLIGSVGVQRIGAAAGVVGLELKGGGSWLGDRNLGAGDGQAVFIDDGENDGDVRCGRLASCGGRVPKKREDDEDSSGLGQTEHEISICPG